jgi:hypothetical protein
MPIEAQVALGGRLGASLGSSWELLAGFWAHLGASWTPFGASWTTLGAPFGVSWKPLGEFLVLRNAPRCPKRLPRHTRRPPRRPNGPPRRTRKPSRWPNRLPKRAQNCSRAAPRPFQNPQKFKSRKLPRHLLPFHPCFSFRRSRIPLKPSFEASQPPKHL